MKFRLLLVFAATLMASACSTDSAGDNAITPSGPTGKIRGIVRLTGNPPAPAVEPITAEQGSAVCGPHASLPRLQLGNANGVQNAFVFLEGVKSAAPMKAQQSVLVDQKDCQYVPHSLSVPVGTKLEFTNSDPILHSAVGKQDGVNGPQTLFNIAQPVKGARNLTERALTRPGVVALTCDAGHPWMFAYVFVADHPFVSVTSADGSFVIENVPPGTYKIRMWHEGVNIRKVHRQLQMFEYEDPYEVEKEVVVTANGEAVVDFDFSLR